MVVNLPELANCRLKPFKHQVDGVANIVVKAAFGLFDEMGAGKTKQTIDAAQTLYMRGIIDRVIVIAPAAVRSVWFDPELGELAKHLWKNITSSIFEYHAKTKGWTWQPEGNAPPSRDHGLKWIVTNYDFIRREERETHLATFCGPRTLLVLDESSAVKNHAAKQTKACLRLRRKCGRVLLLNGTPIANSPLDMYSQGLIMDPRILNCQSFYHFRARYAVMGGFQNKQIKGWTNLEDLQRRFKPFVIRRLKIDCIDLPPKLPPITLSPALTPDTWNIYKEMRDELVAFLEGDKMVTAPQAIVKVMRLRQITAGFLGGLQDSNLEDEDEERPLFVPPAPQPAPGSTSKGPGSPQVATQGQGMGNPTLKKSQPLEVDSQVAEIGREKLTFFLEWLSEQLEADKNIKILAFCCFRPEVERLGRETKAMFPQITVGQLWGNQKPAERQDSIRLLDPRTMPAGPVVVFATQGTGSVGLNLSGAHTVIYLTNSYSMFLRLQSEDRVHRPGQTYPVSYFDVVATGPNGQKTIDHAIMKALRNKEDVANFTTGAWLQILREE